MFPIRDHLGSGKFPFITLLIIAANIYVFFLELTVPNIDQFVSLYGLIPARISLTDPQTLTPFVTSLFLHAGFLHILSNMWFLWIFGDNIEAKMGEIKFMLFYLICGFAASLTQFIFIPDSNLPMIGASGAIAGVLGAYLRFFPSHKVDTLVPVFGLPIIVAIPTSIMLIYWFIIQAFSGVATIFTAAVSLGGVAYLAHAGGFLAGFILSGVFATRR